VTPRSKDHVAKNTTHYLFPECFPSLHAKKSPIVFNATNVQNGHRFFLDFSLRFENTSGVICLISCLIRCLRFSILFGFVT
jgi:hypothetical protein